MYIQQPSIHSGLVKQPKGVNTYGVHGYTFKGSTVIKQKSMLYTSVTLYQVRHMSISDLKRSIQYKDLVDFCGPIHIIWHFPRIVKIWNGHSLSSKYSTASNSLQGEHYNATTIHISYVRRHFMCIASLLATPKHGIQLFTLYMWAGLQ